MLLWWMCDFLPEWNEEIFVACHKIIAYQVTFWSFGVSLLGPYEVLKSVMVSCSGDYFCVTAQVIARQKVYYAQGVCYTLQIG